MGLDTGSLIKTLNTTCLDALQAAAGLCLSKTNPTVEVEHWLLKLLERPDADPPRLFRQFDVDPSRLQRDLERAIAGFRTGNDRTPALSPLIDDLIREAWVLTSVQFKQPKVRSATLLMALRTNDRLARVARQVHDLPPAKFPDLDHRGERPEVLAADALEQRDLAQVPEHAALVPGRSRLLGGLMHARSRYLLNYEALRIRAIRYSPRHQRPALLP